MPDSSAHQPLPRGGLRTLLAQAETPNGLDVPGALAGRIHLVMSPSREGSPEASIWFDGGLIYSATLSNFTPHMARRLQSAACLGEEEFAAVSQIPAEQVSQFVVERRWVTQSLLDELHREMLLSTMTHLVDWAEAVWRFEPGVSTTLFVTTPMPASLVASAVDERIGQWSAVVRNFPYVTQPSSVPKAGPGWAAKAGGEVTPELASLLALVDGRRTIGKIAAQCGFTRFEVTRLLASAVSDQILVFPEAQAAAAKDRDMADDMLATEARAVGPVSREDIKAAEDAVTEARLALQNAQARLASLQAAQNT